MGRLTVRVLGFLLVAATLASVSPARAASPPTAHARVGGDLYYYVDAASHTTVTYDSGVFHITELTLPIQAGPGCNSVNEHEVTCTAPPRGYVYYGTPDDDWVSFAGVPGCPNTCGDPRFTGIFVGDGSDTVYASQGGVTIRSRGGNDLVIGGRGNDHLVSGRGNDVLRGGGGDDLLNAGKGGDELHGGPGADHLEVGKRRREGQDRAWGGRGQDTFRARDGFLDRLSGGRGFDRARIDLGLDRLAGIERLF